MAAFMAIGRAGRLVTTQRILRNKPKIALLTEWFAPGYKAGGPIRSCVNFAREMQHEFDLYVLTADTDFGESQPYPEVQSDTWIAWEPGIQVCYISANAMSRATLQAHLKEINPDFLYLNSMFSLPFTIWPLWMKWRNQLSSGIVLAPRGMLHAGALQYKRVKKMTFLSLIRLSGVSRQISFQATDEQEIKDIRKHFGANTRVQEAANFPVPVMEMPLDLIKEAGTLRMVFISRVSPKKNLDFLLRILPQIKGQVQLDIFGPTEDAAYWETCAVLIAALPPHIQVRYQGELVYEEVRKTLVNYHAFVLPTYGENFGHAIFESLAVARPVLISDQTPWRNLDTAYAGWDIPLDQPQAYVAALDAWVQMDQVEWNTWKTGAWTYARQFLAQARLTEKYRILFSS